MTITVTNENDTPAEAPAPAGGVAPGPPAPATPPATPPAVAAPREIGDEEEPRPGEKIVLTSKQLADRIDRASRKSTSAKLKELLGTDDAAEIKANEDKRKKLEADAETARLAGLGEIERAKEESRIARERASAAEERVAEIEENVVVAQAGEEVKQVAVEYIAPKHWRYVKGELSTHLASKFTVEQLDAMSEKDSEREVRDFLAAYVKENPEFAKKGEQPAPNTERVPLVTGGANPLGGGDVKPAPVITTGKFQGKTLKPGQPNSMNDKEVREWKRANGYT